MENVYAVTIKNGVTDYMCKAKSFDHALKKTFDETLNTSVKVKRLSGFNRLFANTQVVNLRNNATCFYNVQFKESNRKHRYCYCYMNGEGSIHGRMTTNLDEWYRFREKFGKSTECIELQPSTRYVLVEFKYYANQIKDNIYYVPISTRMYPYVVKEDAIRDLSDAYVKYKKNLCFEDCGITKAHDRAFISADNDFVSVDLAIFKINSNLTVTVPEI